MKKIIKACLLICLSLSIMSCTSDINSTTTGTTTETRINPPSWIYGTWADDYDINNYEFTSDDVIFSAVGSSVDYKAMLQSTSSAIYSQTSSSTKFVMTIGDATTTATYTFNNISPTTLNYKISTLGTSFTIVLNKQ